MVLLLVLFAVGGFLRHLSVIGEDLSSSYMGCKLLAVGAQDHLYSHDPDLFNEVGDPLWNAIALQSGFSKTGLLHPYVQTPLWAYLLTPACKRVDFPAFNKSFMALGMCCFAGMIWLVVRHWTPKIFHPGWVLLILVCLYISEPFKYALFLNQTHILFLFLSVAAIICARGSHPVWAGIFLAAAAAIKITPGFLILYWLFARQWKAALSGVLSSIVLAIVTIMVCGAELMRAFLNNLTYVSNVLLVPFNNQSFAATILDHRYPVDLFVWQIYKLPAGVKLISLLATLVFTIIGGLWDRRANEGTPPYGAVMAMLSATLFAPIAWTHYFVILVIPVMLLLDRAREERLPALALLAFSVFLLNVYPVSIGSVHQVNTAVSIVRSQFYATALSMVGLGLMYARARRRELLVQDSSFSASLGELDCTIQKGA